MWTQVFTRLQQEPPTELSMKQRITLSKVSALHGRRCSETSRKRRRGTPGVWLFRRKGCRDALTAEHPDVHRRSSCLRRIQAGGSASCPLSACSAKFAAGLVKLSSVSLACWKHLHKRLFKGMPIPTRGYVNGVPAIPSGKEPVADRHLRNRLRSFIRPGQEVTHHLAGSSFEIKSGICYQIAKLHQMQVQCVLGLSKCGPGVAPCEASVNFEGPTWPGQECPSSPDRVANRSVRPCPARQGPALTGQADSQLRRRLHGERPDPPKQQGRAGPPAHPCSFSRLDPLPYP